MCAIRADCYYFSFDGRYGASSNLCYHYKTISSIHEVCCKPGDYQDANQTLPGWVSGRVPRTRCIEDNAKVYLSSVSSVIMDDNNDFRTSYTVQLGASPLRGAVWIKPRILSDSKLEIQFTPAEVALYDISPVTIVARLAGEVPGNMKDETILIANEVETCDAAFAASSSCGKDEDLQILIDVVAPLGAQRKDTLYILVATVPSVILLILFGTLIYTEVRRRQSNALWKIKASDIEYSDPPEIIGSGKFGGVVKASFCGTSVALKKISPPETPRDNVSGDYMGSLHMRRNAESSSPVQYESNPKDRDIENHVHVSDSRRKHWQTVLEPIPKTKKSIRSRFFSDMQILSQLRHPCIVTIMVSFCEVCDSILNKSKLGGS